MLLINTSNNHLNGEIARRCYYIKKEVEVNAYKEKQNVACPLKELNKMIAIANKNCQY